MITAKTHLCYFTCWCTVICYIFFEICAGIVALWQHNVIRKIVEKVNASRRDTHIHFQIIVSIKLILLLVVLREKTFQCVALLTCYICACEYVVHKLVKQRTKSKISSMWNVFNKISRITMPILPFFHFRFQFFVEYPENVQQINMK